MGFVTPSPVMNVSFDFNRQENGKYSIEKFSNLFELRKCSKSFELGNFRYLLNLENLDYYFLF